MKCKSEQKEILYILTEPDRDRIDAAIKLMRLVFREIIKIRRTRRATHAHTPGDLYALEAELNEIKEEQMKFENF